MQACMQYTLTNMHVCMRIHAHSEMLPISVYAHGCMYLRMVVCIYACCVCVCVCVYACIQINMCIHTSYTPHAFTHLRARAHTHTHTHTTCMHGTYSHTNTHTCTFGKTHTQTTHTHKQHTHNTHKHTHTHTQGMHACVPPTCKRPPASRNSRQQTL